MSITYGGALLCCMLHAVHVSVGCRISPRVLYCTFQTLNMVVNLCPYKSEVSRILVLLFTLRLSSPSSKSTHGALSFSLRQVEWRTVCSRTSPTFCALFKALGASKLQPQF